MLTRRRFLRAVSLGLLAAPFGAQAQPVSRPYRIGYLAPGPVSCPPTRPTEGFRAGLTELGYQEGRSVILDRRCAPTLELTRKTLADILAERPDVLVASSDLVATAMKHVTTIPVVMVQVGDPVGSGFVHSLARPGTNRTGLADLGTDLDSKRVQLLKEAIPGLGRAASLTAQSRGHRFRAFQIETSRAAAALHIDLRQFVVASADEIPGLVASMTKEGAEALLLGQGGGVIWSERGRIVDLAARHRLPTMAPARAYVEVGAFMSYGVDQFELYRRAAVFVDKILKGTRPAELPVEQPTKFELVVNLKTARAFGLTIPPSVLLRADHVVE
jgi:putative ABC transport system substrate-binding protein